jgi:hypothetical protein
MKPDGGSAFPVASAHGYGEHGAWSQDGAAGMTLRDYFAAAALNGMLARQRREVLPPGITTTKDVSDAYEWADAMLAERAK